ncbi:MAG: ABC transporter substrate-binding protein, partial [Planctomycetota bacterium]
SLGRYVDLDLERLTTLAPTHVLAMTGQAGLPKRVGEMADAGRFALTDLPYPGSVDAAVGLIAEVGAAIGRAEAGAALSAEVRRQLDGIAALTRGKQRPSALIVFTVDPVMASGPGTINDELLAIAGGRNAAAGANVSAPVYDREGLRALDPDVVFLMRPGEPPLSGPEDRRLRSFRGLRAVEENRVVLLNDPAVLLPGPAMGTTAVSLAVKLHPELAEPIGAVFADGFADVP